MDPQTIATLVSLLGVVVGISLFYWGKRLERRSVNMAILAEIRRLLDVICRHKKWLEENTGNIDLPLIPFSTPIYNEQAKNIGLLDHRVVANVASFYGYVQFLNSLQMSKAGYVEVNKLQLFEKMYLDSLKTFCKVYGNLFDKAFLHYGV
jgi:hypothetical protein